MSGRMEFYPDFAEPDLLAITNRLRAACKVLAIAQPHDVERPLRRQHRAMTGAGVVGMAMGDHGTLYGAHRIDVEVARFAAEAGGNGGEEGLRTHDPYIGDASTMLSRYART